jgi:tRNA (cmo5U34)-methyltransferase
MWQPHHRIRKALGGYNTLVETRRPTRMPSPPISQAEIDARISEYVDELLELWWAEQGASKPKDLELMALAIPFSCDESIRALDLCCGPGDAGRAIRRVYPKAQIDFIDQDPFLASICRAVNQRDGMPGKVVVRDLEDGRWLRELPGKYDVVTAVNALHWFDPRHADKLIKEVHGTLRDGGLFLLAEPVSPETPFAPGFDEWKAKQPPRYTRENWEQFWSRANALLGYDHTTLLGPRGANRIGEQMSVAGWLRLLKGAGFELIDVLWRDADQVILAASK